MVVVVEDEANGAAAVGRENEVGRGKGETGRVVGSQNMMRLSMW